jgi:hypothetical protein
MGTESTVNVLWTGGWDSTFRLLQLLLVEKREVQTYYIVDPNRWSSDREIQAMKKMRSIVLRREPFTQALFPPLIITELREIPADAEITRQYRKLDILAQENNLRLGTQYEWLALFAKAYELTNLELGVETNPERRSFVSTFLLPESVPVPTEPGGVFRLKDTPSIPELALFHPFRFPLLQVSKLDMQQKATRYGFADILQQYTWFCHQPLREQACGTCQPCHIAIKEGMGRRIPLRGRIRHFLKFAILPLVPAFLRPVAGRLNIRTPANKPAEPVYESAN